MNSDIRQRKLLKVIKIIIWLLPLFLLVWILHKHFVLGGQYEVIYDVTEQSALIRNFASKEDYKFIGSLNLPGSDPEFQLITKSPVYFDVKIPRAFEKAKVSFKFLNPDNQKEMKLGVRQSNGAYYYENFMFPNPVIESLDDYWIAVKEGNVILWQKDVSYFELKEEKIDQLDQKWASIIREEYGRGYEILSDEKKKILLDNKKDTEEYIKELSDILYEIKADKNENVTFSSIDDFISSNVPTNKIVQFNYPMRSTIELPNYQASQEGVVIEKSLRGSHEIWTYIGKNENLDYTFLIQDLNRHAGEDNFQVSVFDFMNNKVGEVISPDDGDATASGKIRTAREVHLLIENLPFGTYKLLINIPQDDIFINKITTKQHLLFFRNKLYLTDNVEYRDILGDKELLPTQLVTNSTYIKSRTAHDNGLQTIKAGWQNLNIDEKHILKKVELDGELNKIEIPLNDVYIEGNGYFAFSEDHIFDPDYGIPQNINNIKDIDKFDYIIARYPEQKVEDGWFIAEATIKQPFLYVNDNGQDRYINFIISLPDLNENNRQLLIKELKIIFSKEPITFNNFFSRLKNWIAKK